jgi:hypothetical protein
LVHEGGCCASIWSETGWDPSWNFLWRRMKIRGYFCGRFRVGERALFYIYIYIYILLAFLSPFLLIFSRLFCFERIFFFLFFFSCLFFNPFLSKFSQFFFNPNFWIYIFYSIQEFYSALEYFIANELGDLDEHFPGDLQKAWRFSETSETGSL